jgi:hypothetical protein
MVPAIDLNSGWGGLGLKGIRSSGNLQRSSSDASGLFIDEEEPKPLSAKQDPGERTEMPPKKTSSTSLRKDQVRNGADLEGGNAYVKTTSMARFYYRKTGHNEGSHGISCVHKAKSDPAMDGATNSSIPTAEAGHVRRKSKSHADLDQVSFEAPKDSP